MTVKVHANDKWLEAQCEHINEAVGVLLKYNLFSILMLSLQAPTKYFISFKVIVAKQTHNKTRLSNGVNA